MKTDKYLTNLKHALETLSIKATGTTVPSDTVGAKLGDDITLTFSSGDGEFEHEVGINPIAAVSLAIILSSTARKIAHTKTGKERAEILEQIASLYDLASSGLEGDNQGNPGCNNPDCASKSDNAAQAITMGVIRSAIQPLMERDVLKAALVVLVDSSGNAVGASALCSELSEDTVEAFRAEVIRSADCIGDGDRVTGHA